MRRFSIALIAAASVALTQIATAADVPPLYNWTGPHIGIAAGYGWGHSDQTDSGIPCYFFGTPGSLGSNGGAGGNGGGRIAMRHSESIQSTSNLTPWASGSVRP